MSSRFFYILFISFYIRLLLLRQLDNRSLPFIFLPNPFLRGFQKFLYFIRILDAMQAWGEGYQAQNR